MRYIYKLIRYVYTLSLYAIHHTFYAIPYTSLYTIHYTDTLLPYSQSLFGRPAFWAHSFSLTEVLYFHGPATLEQLVPRKYGKLPAHGRQPPKRHAQLIGDQARNLNIKWLNGWLFVNLSTICSSAPPPKKSESFGIFVCLLNLSIPKGISGPTLGRRLPPE